eukprot:scaffold279580_cov17-Tisochrysis_lutea.AAC.1
MIYVKCTTPGSFRKWTPWNYWSMELKRYNCVVLFLHLLQNRALGACTTGLQETEKRNHASQRRPRAFWKGSLTCKLARVSPKGLQTLTAHS